MFLDIDPFPYYFVIPRQWIWVTRDDKSCRLANIHPKIYQIIYETTISIIYTMRKTVAIIHIDGARAVLYFFVIPLHWIWVNINGK